MKKILGLLAATAVLFGLLSGIAMAQTGEGCSIINTGPGSNNTCSSQNNQNLVVTCTNNADVVFVNGQSTSSGSATLTFNGNGGYAYSGNAVNQNSTNTGLDVSCQLAQAQTSTTPTTPSTPPTVQAPTNPTTVKALPNTGSNDALPMIVLATGGIIVLALASRLSLSGYRHLLQK